MHLLFIGVLIGFLVSQIIDYIGNYFKRSLMRLVIFTICAYTVIYLLPKH